MTTLKDRLQFVLDEYWHGNASQWSTKAGLQRVHVSKLLSREGTDEGSVQLNVVQKLAEAAGVSPGWLAYGIGTPSDSGHGDLPINPQVGTVLIKLANTPGLRAWVESNPGAITVSELIQGVAAFEASPSLSRASDGSPGHGWSAFFADLRAGRLAPSSAPGEPDRVASLERSRLEAPLRRVPGGTKPPKSG